METNYKTHPFSQTFIIKNLWQKKTKVRLSVRPLRGNSSWLVVVVTTKHGQWPTLFNMENMKGIIEEKKT